MSRATFLFGRSTTRRPIAPSAGNDYQPDRKRLALRTKSLSRVGRSAIAVCLLLSNLAVLASAALVGLGVFTPTPAAASEPGAPGLEVQVENFPGGDGGRLQFVNFGSQTIDITSADVWVNYKGKEEDYNSSPQASRYGTITAPGNISPGNKWDDTPGEIDDFPSETCTYPNKTIFDIRITVLANGTTTTYDYIDQNQVLNTWGVDLDYICGSGIPFVPTYSWVNLSPGVSIEGAPLGNDLHGGGSHSEPGCNCTAADPVQLATGDFSETATDLTVPGAGGIPLDFTRTYDSVAAHGANIDSISAGMGPGWYSNLLMNVSVSGSTATVTEENGAQVQFSDTTPLPVWCTPGTIWCPTAPRVLASLTKTANGWTFIRRVGSPMTFYFNTSGALYEFQDAAGDTVQSSSYSGTGCPSGSTCTEWQENGSSDGLVVATSPETDGNNVNDVVKVFDVASQESASFTYARSACSQAQALYPDELCSASDPSGQDNYSYYPTTDQMTGATTPTQGTINNTYVNGQVTEQCVQDGGPVFNVTTFAYASDSALPQGTSTTVTTYPDGIVDSGGNQTCTLEGSPVTDVSTYQFSNDVLITKTIGVGASNQATTQYTPDAATLVPTVTVDPNGNLTREQLDVTSADPFAAADPTVQVDAPGTITEDGYTSDNLVYCSMDAADMDVYVAANPNGNSPCPALSSLTAQPPNSGSDPYLGMTINYYNSKDELLWSSDPLGNVSVYAYTLGNGVPDGLKYCSIDAANYARGITTCPSYGNSETGASTETFTTTGDIASATDATGAATTYSYTNPQFPGLVTSETDPQGDVTANTYDAAGRLIEQVKGYGTSYSSTSITNYDANGRAYCTISSLDYAEGYTACPTPPPTTLPSQSDPWPGVSVNIYNAAGQVVDAVNPLGGVTYTAYDGAGRPYCTITPRNFSTGGASLCPSAPPTSAPAPGSAWPGASVTVFDPLGLKIAETDPVGDITTYVNDPNGNVIAQTVTPAVTANDPASTTYFQYDADGQQIATCTDPDGKAPDQPGTCGVAAFQGVSCPTTTYCLAVDNMGNTSTYNGTSWSTPTHSTGFTDFTAVSCASATYCVMVDNTGNWADTTGHSGTVEAGVALTAVSCPSATFCMAIDQAGNAISFNGSSWAPPHALESGGTANLNGLSCASTSFCVAVDSAGDEFSYSSSGWSAGLPAETGNPPALTAVSCVSTIFCMIGDALGNVVQYNSSTGTFSAPFKLSQPGSALTAISCASITSCEAADAQGEGYNFTGSVWGEGGLDNGNLVNSISCVSATCEATDSVGFIMNGVSPATATLVDAPTVVDRNTRSFYDPNGNVYCSVSPKAYALGPWGILPKVSDPQNTNTNNGGWKCPSWQSSWITAPPLPSSPVDTSFTGPTTPLYSYTWGGANAVTTSFYNANANLVQQAEPGLEETQSTSGAAPDVSTTVTVPDPDGHPACTVDPSNLADYFALTSPPASYKISWPYQCADSSYSEKTTTSYDDAGRVVSTTDSEGNTTGNSYDDSHAVLTSTQNPDGNSTNYCYGFQNGPGQCAEALAGGSWDAPAQLAATVNKVSCPTASFCAAVDATGNAYTETNGNWSGVATLTSGGVALDSLDCASASFCVAGDAQGNAYVVNGNWSSPTATLLDSGKEIESISCPTATFCAAVDAAGHAFIYNSNGGSGSWSSSVLVSAKPSRAVSCPSPTFCSAVSDSGKVFDYNGASWTQAATLTATATIFYGVSCASSTLCVAGDATGSAFVFNGTWSTTPSVLNAAGKAITAVSCAPSTESCAAGDNVGNAYTLTNGNWSAAAVLQASSKIYAMSCATSTMCSAVIAAGKAFTYNGANWSTGVTLDASHAIESVSCPTPFFCAAGNNADQTYLFHGSTWQPPFSADGSNGISGVSCPSVAECFTVDGYGQVRSWLNGSMSTANTIDSTDLTTISCAAVTSCVAGDLSGNALTYSGGSWTSTPLNAGPVASVSCPTATFCMLGTSEGSVATGIGSSWTHSGGLSSGAASVSCASATFCAATTVGGVGYVWTGSWSAAHTLDASKAVYVSCPTNGFCLAVDAAGKAYTYSNGAWSAATTIASSHVFTAIDCPSATSCQAVDTIGEVYTYNGTGWSLHGAGIDGTHSLTAVSCSSAGFCAAVDGSGNMAVQAGAVAASAQWSTTAPATLSARAGMWTANGEYPDGSAAAQWTAAGLQLRYYDPLGDLVVGSTSDISSGLTPASNVGFAYNPDGTRAQMTDGTGVTSYSYDAAGDLQNQSFAAGSGTNLANEAVSYTWDAQGTLGSVVYPSYSTKYGSGQLQVPNPTATYAYDANGDMSSVSDWWQGTVSFQYDADGNVINQAAAGSDFNGATASQSTRYDLADRATHVTLETTLATGGASQVANDLGTSVTGGGQCQGSPVVTASFAMGPLNGGSRNADGQILATNQQITDNCGDSFAPVTRYFNYSPAGQLTWANTSQQVPPASPLYSYDPAGNMTLYSNTASPSGPVSYNDAYDAADELVSQTAVSGGGSTTFGYDPVGDRVSATNSSGTTSYGYDSLGEMTSFSGSSGSGAYTYNGDGLQATVTQGSGPTNQLIWQGTGSPPNLLSDGNDYFIYGPGQTPVEQVNLANSLGPNGITAMLYAGQDGLSTYAVVDGAGGTSSWINYDPYGNHDPSVSPDSNFGFAGQYEDGTSGLYNMRARWYDPGTGAFTTVDPMLTQTGQPYEYAGDDPVNAGDPSGNMAGGIFLPCGPTQGNGKQSGSSPEGDSEIFNFFYDRAKAMFEGFLEAAVNSYVGYAETSVGQAQSGDIYFEANTGDITQQAVVEDPNQGVFSVEKFIDGLAPEYLLPNGTWIDSLRLTVTQRVHLRIAIEGDYPETGEAAHTWYLDLKATMVTEYNEGIRNPDTIEAYDSENLPGFPGYGSDDGGAADLPDFEIPI